MSAVKENDRMQGVLTILPEPREPRASHYAPRRDANRVTRLMATTMARPAVRHGSLSLFDQAVVSGTSFVTSMIVGRLCSKEELGVFYLALTVVYLARGIQEQVVSAPYVIYHHRRRGEALAMYSGSALLHYAGVTAVSLLMLLGLLGMLSIGIGPTGLAPVAWILMGALPLLLLREFIRRFTVAHLEMVAAIAIDASVAAIQLGGLLALAYYHKLTVTSAYITMGAACAIACAGWFMAKRRPMRFSWSRAVADWRHNWGFGRWALMSHMVGSISPYLMPWFVIAARGKAEAGVLAACLSLAGVASMFVVGVATYLTPKAALAFHSGGVDELRRVLRVAALVYAAVLGAFALFVLATGDFLLVLAFGSKYAGYGGALGIMAASMTALGMSITAGNGLWAIDRPKANFAADATTLFTNLTVVLCLVQPLGVYGAALADLGGNIIGAAVRYATLRRHLKTIRHASETL